MNDINGNPITDPFGQPGFPGFDSMSAATTLGYVAQMQEAGIPIIYAYISDVHDNHAGGGAYGPGEAGTSTAEELRRRLREVLRPARRGRHRQEQHAVRRSPPTRTTTSPASRRPNATASTRRAPTTPPPGLALGGKPAARIFDVTNGGTTPSPLRPGRPHTERPLVGEVGYNIKWTGLLGSTINGTGTTSRSTRPRASTSTTSRRRLALAAMSSSTRRCAAFEQAAGEPPGIRPVCRPERS